MDKNIWDSSRVSHIAIVVNDIEKALDNYCAVFHMEKPLIKMTGTPEMAKVMYREKSSKAMAKQAFLQFGTLRVEFIEPDMHPSTWREYLEKKGSGIHHIAYEIENMNMVLKELKNQGIELIQKGEYNHGQYAYVGSEEKLEIMLELLENYN